jgi:probable HAF family extracellular repeat protein
MHVEQLEDRCCPSTTYNFTDHTLGGANSQAFAVNKSGQVAGAAQLASGYANGFLYSSGVMNPLGPLFGWPALRKPTLHIQTTPFCGPRQL